MGLHQNCKAGSNTAPNWSPSQLLDISYYRNQSLSTGAHSRKSCRFQFYIVINAAGEENFTTIAGADCTNPDLLHPMTLWMRVPTHTIATAPSFEVVSTKPELGWLLERWLHFSMASLDWKTYSFLHIRSPGENNKTSTNCKVVGRFKHVCKHRESKRFTGSTVRSQPRAPLETAHLPFLLHPVQKNNPDGGQVTD